MTQTPVLISQTYPKPVLLNLELHCFAILSFEKKSLNITPKIVEIYLYIDEIEVGPI